MPNPLKPLSDDSLEIIPPNFALAYTNLATHVAALDAYIRSDQSSSLGENAQGELDKAMTVIARMEMESPLAVATRRAPTSGLGEWIDWRQPDATDADAHGTVQLRYGPGPHRWVAARFEIVKPGRQWRHSHAFVHHGSRFAVEPSGDPTAPTPQPH